MMENENDGVGVTLNGVDCLGFLDDGVGCSVHSRLFHDDKAAYHELYNISYLIKRTTL